ncbi:hypothetical protein NX059_000833 [Plenodomus lindquistii]|nr:hypothetical protein NX059_000833 [Plenodomus lindquistii]
MNIAKPLFNWPQFDVLCDLTLDYVVPRLLLPLQAHGRVLKPSLVHGDCWDGNTAQTTKMGAAVIFDPCAFYGHNEYDTGNWRAQRHVFSSKEYIDWLGSPKPEQDLVQFPEQERSAWLLTEFSKIIIHHPENNIMDTLALFKVRDDYPKDGYVDVMGIPQPHRAGGEAVSVDPEHLMSIERMSFIISYHCRYYERYCIPLSPFYKEHLHEAEFRLAPLKALAGVK